MFSHNGASGQNQTGYVSSRSPDGCNWGEFLLSMIAFSNR